ncbi:hypothetical protein D3879_23765 [Pseudomonas cavernicola]|uniref:Uncharacterized protein n=1 Tax=Pseudomonas cavernicola TaxID=2320866 RepID=A0A418X8U0_9PSED|nr:hypothetical protein [Pseudomonas cavernicola]RJG08871.1 hypothetical protein D3879_23765 [Pseudomonas cavernicola]
MPTNDLIPSLIFKLNENQLAIAAAVEELSRWVELHGSADVAVTVRATLATLDKNLTFITRGIADLMND